MSQWNDNYLKLGDISTDKINSVIDLAFDPQFNSEYRQYFHSAIIREYNFRYMCVNNEDIALDFLKNTSQIVRPVLWKMVQAEYNANPEYGQINIGLTNTGNSTTNSNTTGNTHSNNTQDSTNTQTKTGTEKGVLERDMTVKTDNIQDTDNTNTLEGTVVSNNTQTKTGTDKTVVEHNTTVTKNNVEDTTNTKSINGTVTTIGTQKKTGTDDINNESTKTTIDTSIKSETNIRTGSEQDTGNSTGTTDTTNTGDVTVTKTSGSNRTLDDTTTKTNSGTTTQNQKGVKTTTEIPAAQIITKDITMNIVAPQSQSGFVSDIAENSTGGVNVVQAASVTGSTPFETDERRISGAVENVHYAGLLREPTGNYAENKTTETWGFDDTPLKTETVLDNKETIGKTGEHNIIEDVNATGEDKTIDNSKFNVQTSSNDTKTKTYNNLKDEKTITGKDTNSSNLKVTDNGNQTTTYNNTITDNNTVTTDNTDSLTGKVTSNGTDKTTGTDTTNTTYNTTIQDDTTTTTNNTDNLKGKVVDNGTQHTTGTDNNTVTYDTNLKDVGNTTSNSDVTSTGTSDSTTTNENSNNGFNVDRSELTHSFINLLKNDGIFKWFVKQYEDCFASSYDLDCRAWYECTYPVRG